MSTLPPPPSKKQKTALAALTSKQQDPTAAAASAPSGSVRLRFFDNETDAPLGPSILVPLAQATTKNLNLLVNSLKSSSATANSDDTDTTPDTPENVPYSFTHRSGPEIIRANGLDVSLGPAHDDSLENEQSLTIQPEAVYKVRAVTRCSASLPGHEKAVLAVQFAPDASACLASGSGDASIRIWDCETGTSMHVLRGHTSWVLALAWAPDAQLLASGGMDNAVRLWKPRAGKAIGGPLRGHTKWITGIAWEPLHVQASGRPRVASSSKDATVRVWDVLGQRADAVLGGHTACVTCVKWGGDGCVYTASQDRTVRVWREVGGGGSNRGGADFKTVRVLSAHAHWVNHLALSTDGALRTGFYETGSARNADVARLPEGERMAVARQRYRKVASEGGKVVERLVTASDDNTMALWEPAGGSSGSANSGSSSKPIARMTGHQKQVTHVAFSPNGRWIASAGWDSHVKLWRASDGAFVANFRGHVAAVYQVCFSGDSRLLVSASKDSTVKVWDIKTAKLMNDLPGHADEVFAVDWAPDGQRVASGGKDKAVKIWRH